MQNLQVGSTDTTAIKQLQQQLNSSGANPPLAVDGKFGPLTQAALKNYQGSHNLVPDGIYGPKTAASFNQPIKNVTTPTPSVTDKKALFLAVSDVSEKATKSGRPPLTLDEAFNYAKQDPDIISKYADLAKLDKQGFIQSLDYYQTQFSNQSQQYKKQFENDRKALAEQQAAAGTAYSGFRGKAQADLAQQESGIITSARAQQKQALNQLTSAFESKYGTAATPNASLTLDNPLLGNTSISGLEQTPGGSTTITGEKAGGIVGTQEPAKSADILQKEYDIYNLGQFPVK